MILTCDRIYTMMVMVGKGNDVKIRGFSLFRNDYGTRDTRIGREDKRHDPYRENRRTEQASKPK